MARPADSSAQMKFFVNARKLTFPLLIIAPPLHPNATALGEGLGAPFGWRCGAAPIRAKKAENAGVEKVKFN